MEQLRSDPDVAGSGIWTYQQAIADPSTPAAGTTLGEYVATWRRTAPPPWTT